MEAHPASSLFFVGVLVTVGMGVLNLILGVVVNVFTLAHDQIQQEIILEERIEKLETQQHLRHICESLDEDGTGELTQEQMRVGFDSHPDFHSVMDSLEVTADDLEIVWTIIDTEHSGAVSYQKFVDQVYLMKDNDTHFMLAYIKYYITKIKETLLKEIKSNKEMIEKEAELENFMMKEVEAEERKVEKMMLQADKKVEGVENIAEVLLTVETDPPGASCPVANGTPACGEKLPPQKYYPQANGSTQERQNRGIADTKSPLTPLALPNGIKPDPWNGITSVSEMLLRKLTEIHCSLDKQMSEIGVLIEDVTGAKHLPEEATWI